MCACGKTVRRGDTYLSSTWAVVLDGLGVDLTAGWTVRAQARDRAGAVVVDFGATTGSEILLSTADVDVAGDVVTTSTIRLYMDPDLTAELAPRERLPVDVEIEHPSFGPVGDLYRVTVVSDVLVVAGDVTRGGL